MTTTAMTPEQIADRLVFKHETVDSDARNAFRDAIATAIRQHSAPLEAQITELTAKLQAADAAHYDATEGISATLQADALEAAEARATTAEAALEREKALREALEQIAGASLVEGEPATVAAWHWNTVIMAARAALQTKEDGNG